MFFNFFHGLITYDEKAWQYILFTIRSFYFDYIKKEEECSPLVFHLQLLLIIMT